MARKGKTWRVERAQQGKRLKGTRSPERNWTRMNFAQRSPLSFSKKTDPRPVMKLRRKKTWKERIPEMAKVGIKMRGFSGPAQSPGRVTPKSGKKRRAVGSPMKARRKAASPAA